MLCLHANKLGISPKFKAKVSSLVAAINHQTSVFPSSINPMLVIYAQVEESKHHSWVSCNSGDLKSHEINHHNNTCNGFRKHGTPNTTSGILTPQDKFHNLYKPYRTITTPPGSMDNHHINKHCWTITNLSCGRDHRKCFTCHVLRYYTKKGVINHENNFTCQYYKFSPE
jgi:hypothetical protein